MEKVREKAFQAQVEMIYAVCPMCNEGLMTCDHEAPQEYSYPPLYKHTCTVCGHSEKYRRDYPYPRYAIDLTAEGREIS